MNIKVAIRFIVAIFALGFAKEVNSQYFEWVVGSEASGWLLNSETVTVSPGGEFHKTGVTDESEDYDYNPHPDETLILSPEGSETGNSAFFLKLDSIGGLDWAGLLNSSWSSFGNCVESDESGNLYIWGSYKHDMDANPDPDIEYYMPGWWYDCFLVKLDDEGTFIWAKRFESYFYEFADNMAINTSGEMIISGTTEGDLDADPGIGVHTLPRISEPGELDNFIIKLDDDGELEWGRSWGKFVLDTEPLNFEDIFLDNLGNVFITGTYEMEYDFDPGPGVYLMTPSGEEETFILKLDADGNFDWATSFPPTDADDEFLIHAMTVSESGYLYCTGEFIGEVDVDPTPAVELISTDSSGRDAFVLKFETSTGNLVWEELLVSNTDDMAYDIALDETENIWLTGATTSGTFDLDPGPGVEMRDHAGSRDLFVLELDSDGGFVWGELIGGSEWDYGMYIGLDEDQDIYVSGVYGDEVDFNFDIGEAILESSEVGNTFYMKIGGDCPEPFVTADTACIEYMSPSGMIYTETGIYTEIDTNFYGEGCDRVSIYNVVVNAEPEMGYTEIGACEEYTVPSGDETYYATGTYLDTVLSVHGCDSVITIDLTILEKYTAINVTECTSYEVPSGDETHYLSGIYTDTLTNIYGCDSILTIYLTILEEDVTITSVSTCEEAYTVPSGDETYYASGTYLDTLTNIDGCDSLLVIYLTINSEEMTETSVTACNSYTVPSGDETYYASGVYSDTLTGISGCDSIVTIDLTLNSLDAEITSTEITLYAFPEGLTYQWVDCDNDFEPIDGATDQTFIAPMDGSYAVIITDGECTDTSECLDFLYFSISENGNSQIQVYPNPSNGHFEINFGESTVDASVRLFTTRGQLVYENTNIQDQVLSVDFEGASGFYWMEITRNGESQMVKIIKFDP